jgi:4-aminobutyrate aminotransferase/(S)-3-amino-2-methylpropionate transaminase
MFAYEHYDIQPNLLCLGKGLGSGVTIAAVLGEDRLMDSLRPGDISSTYGGNPLCCAAALAAIDIYEREGLVQKAAETGDWMAARFRSMQDKSRYVGDVRGMGLVFGIEFVVDKESKKPGRALAQQVVEGCFRRGLALIAPLGLYNNVIRIAPPLMIGRELAQRGLDLFEEVLMGLESS